MKKIFSGIIVFISFLSISNVTFADKEPYLERLLDLNYGVQDYELQLVSVDEMYFFDSGLQDMHSEFKKTNEKLKVEIIKYYRSDRFNYYQMQGILQAHRDFIYSTNQIFQHMRMKELNPYYVDVDTAVLNNYRKSRSA
ncbi:MAG: hypothetical protein GY828_03775, partial [Candidatus Gracilibacteria bacterium]|nr:hypothetical protein [Candidatus Gracilibacteria bacterium]